MIISSGIEAFDARVGGLRPGGLYLVTGAPGAGKLPFLLQFLAAGLEADERLAFLGGYSPEELFEQCRHWGLDALETSWQGGRFAVLGFRGEFPRRILQAVDPQDAFNELTDLLDGPVSRLAVDPGTMLWETRAGTAMAEAFLSWQAALGATVMASASAGLQESLPHSTERVVQKATGTFHLARLQSGLHELTVQRVRPPIADPGTITLELSPGTGLGAPTRRPGRRVGDSACSGRRRLLLLRLSEEIQEDAYAWLTREYEVSEIRDPLQVAARLQTESWGGICILVDRAGVDVAIDVCRVTRPLTSGAMVLLSRGQLRSSDRARAMEAGADDVLRQDVVLRELQTRFRRAAACVQRPREWTAGDDRTEPIRELLEQDRFVDEVSHRLDSAAHGYLTLILVPESVGIPVREALRCSLRVEAGDFMGGLANGFGVVLQDARQRHALVFLERALQSLEPVSGAPEVKILTSPEEADAIRDVLAN